MLYINITLFFFQTKFMNWSVAVESHVDSSFFWGYLVTQIPGGFIASRFPANKIFGLSIVCSATLHLLVPAVMALCHGYVLIGLRVTQGLFEVSACTRNGSMQIGLCLWKESREPDTYIQNNICHISINDVTGNELSRFVWNSICVKQIKATWIFSNLRIWLRTAHQAYDLQTFKMKLYDMKVLQLHILLVYCIYLFKITHVYVYVYVSQHTYACI